VRRGEGPSVAAADAAPRPRRVVVGSRRSGGSSSSSSRSGGGSGGGSGVCFSCDAAARVTPGCRCPLRASASTLPAALDLHARSGLVIDGSSCVAPLVQYIRRRLESHDRACGAARSGAVATPLTVDAAHHSSRRARMWRRCDVCGTGCCTRRGIGGYHGRCYRRRHARHRRRRHGRRPTCHWWCCCTRRGRRRCGCRRGRHRRRRGGRGSLHPTLDASAAVDNPRHDARPPHQAPHLGTNFAAARKEGACRGLALPPIDHRRQKWPATAPPTCCHRRIGRTTCRHRGCHHRRR